ncbi:MAG: hypothetical protein FWF63_01940 [Fibromonadales bacterium]|nr:hypothetical protein [Fibromonadales bacterium]
MRIKILFSLFFFVSFVYAQSESDFSNVEARLDSLGEYASSGVIGKDDSPVAVSGDFVVRFAHTDYAKTSTLQGSENLRTFVNSALTATIVVSPASFLTLFSNLYLPFDFGGFFTNRQAFNSNAGNYNVGERVQWFHPSTDFYGASINENMLAGLDMRGGQFGATLMMGGVIWTSQSPLTVYERETSPRFVSQYELYEEEKVVSTYYKEKGFKPVKEGGRAFWTNRSFGGMLLDVHTLPWNFKGQVLLSQPNSVDIGTRDGLRLNTRDNSELAMVGTYDYRGKVVGGRFAKEKIDFDQASLTVGANYMGINFDPEQIYENDVFPNAFTFSDTTAKFENLHVASIDLKGNINPQFFLSFDLAFSWDDTTSFRATDSTCLNPNPSLSNPTNSMCYNASNYSSSTSAPVFGLYIKAQDKHWEPITLEVIYLPKDFYSPYSMANPDRVSSWRKDQFYIGAGTFRYGPNMVGANIKLEPEFDRGRFDVQYGVHRQVEEGADIISFKYNLVGRYLWETSTSWTKHKPFFKADSGYNDRLRRYTYRVARGSVSPRFKLSDQEGGLRSGYGETWDAFTPYESAQDAFYCAQLSYFGNAPNVPCNMPTNVKWNSTLAFDMGYDIGHWFGTERNVMLQLYTALSGVSKSFIPVAYTDKYDNDMLMWNWFAQSEPAIAITPKFHAILIFGLELFHAEKAYAELVLNPTGIGKDNQPPKSPPSSYDELYKKNIIYDYRLSPINIMHTSMGFGFDWDFAARAGLHFRYRYLTSKDENLPQNDWNVHYIQAETKVWF